MPYPNEHAARIKNPELFQETSFRRKNIDTGVDIVIGKLTGEDSTITQSYRFDKKKFSADEAKKWLKDNEINYIKFEAAIKAFQEKIVTFSEKIKAYQNDIINKIPKQTLHDIMSKDKHPFFQMYCLCHEGQASPYVENEGGKKIHWSKKAIQSIKNTILKGVKLFKGHNKRNNIRDKKIVGEVIHSFEEEKKGKLYHNIITYHSPAVREDAKGYDICSQEAEWDLVEMPDGNLFADAIKKITGIAVANSKKYKPAFAEAKRLGYIQAFENNETREDDNMSDFNNEKKQISFKEWLAMKDQFHVYPWQVFKLDELKSDREFGQYFTELEKVKNENEQIKNNKESEKQELLNELKEYRKQNYLNSAGKRLQRICEEKNIDGNMRQFIDQMYEEEKTNYDELTDETLEKFIEKSTKAYQQFMKFQNINQDVPNIDQNEDEEDENKDFSKAKNNEFLEDDLDIEDF